MALTVNNAGWNKSAFRSNYTYKWTPGTPTVSPSATATNNSAITVTHGATKAATGSLAITYMNGKTTSGTNSYSSDAKLWLKMDANSFVSMKSGGIKFNTSWTNWSINKTVGTYTENASARLNFYINNTTTTMNKCYLNTAKNLSSAITNIQYSKDNATWQDSNVITGLSPNTTYTLYVKAIATSATGETTTGYGSTSAKTGGNGPTYTATAGSIARTSFVITPSSISYEQNASFSSFKVEWGTSTAYSTGSNTNTSSAAAYTITNLAANTLYYWRTTLTDNQGHYTQKTGSITTTGNAPSYTATAGSITRTGFTVTPSSISYDTNASFKSFKVEWGTSTSYGSSNTNTTSAAAYSITGLTANTTYYWRTTLTDSKDRYTQKTGNITTTGNAPSITAVSKDIYRNSCVLSSTVTYDTNASFSSVSIQYGTSTSYGSTSSSYTISNLNPNTTYYYSMTVTDNKNRTSSASTGSFKTTAYMPYNLSISATNTSSTGTSLTVSGSGDTNTGITNYTYYYTPKPTVNTYDMPIKSFQGARWARIFYHNNKKGTVLFTSLTECKNTQTADKYSRLGLLDSGDTYKINGKYEFLLEYPLDDPTHYNRWRQTNAPQNEFITRSETGGQVTGYEAVHIDWTSNYWGGLERNNTSTTSYSPTWLDASTGHGNWFYAIGASSTHGRGIPSYNSTADVVELWIRIPDGTVTSSSMGTSTTATVTGLTANTDYMFVLSATNAAGTNYSSAIQVTTSSGQASMTVKVNGVWTTGTAYVKINGAWKPAEKVYIKVNGTWKEQV